MYKDKSVCTKRAFAHLRPKGAYIMKKSDFLQCGEIINTHGVRGVVKARSDCDSPDILASLERIYTDPDGKKPLEIKDASIQKGFVLLTLEGVDSVEAAVMLKGTVIYASREDLLEFMEEGDRFIADLIGLPVIHADTKEQLGTLRDVINRGASDIYIIDTDAGERMMPAVAEFVTEMTDDAIFVRPIPGMLD